MKRILQRVKQSLLGTERQAQQTISPLRQRAHSSTFGLIRSTPMMRMYLKQSSAKEWPHSELGNSMKEYSELSAKNKLNIRVVSEIFDILTRQRHDQNEIRDGFI